jgi:hypothetical protein
VRLSQRGDWVGAKPSRLRTFHHQHVAFKYLTFAWNSWVDGFHILFLSYSLMFHCSKYRSACIVVAR